MRLAACCATRKPPNADGRKKLLLVYAVSEPSRQLIPESKRGVMAPLWAAIIAGLTPEDEWDIRFVDECRELCPLDEPADLVGISAMSMNAARAYQLALAFRERSIPVVMGGWHISAFPEEALQFCDAVVVGEAERAWPLLLEDFKTGSLRKVYREFRPELTPDIPLPRRSVYPMKYMCGSVQFGRGCSGNCDFCSIGTLYGKGVRYRPIEQVLDDVESCPEKMIFFVDENFTGHSRKEQAMAVRLLREWERRSIRKKWFSMGSVEMTENEELLELMRRTGCMMMLIGFEDIAPRHLQSFNKRVNARTDYFNIIEKLHAYDIAVIGAFILGSPGHTAEDIRAIFDFCLESSLDVPQFAVAAPIPGSKWWDRYKGDVPWQDFPEAYSTVASAFLPVMPDCSVSFEELIELYRTYLPRLGSMKRILGRFFHWVRRGQMDTAFALMGMSFGTREYFKRFSNLDRIFDFGNGQWLIRSRDENRLPPIPPLPSGPAAARQARCLDGRHANTLVGEGPS